MAVRLGQLPLPWLPEGAAEVAAGRPGAWGGWPRRGWVARDGHVCWGAGDEAGRKLAAVQLTATGAEKVKEVAAAWGGTRPRSGGGRRRARGRGRRAGPG